MQQVAIIDFGMGNLRSVEKAVRFVGDDSIDVLVTADPERVAAADRVIFPGQGAIGDCMVQLAAHGLETCVCTAIREKPFLGICIGLQALMDESEEDGGTRGLAAFRGRVIRFPRRDPTNGTRLKVPHMGWNQVRQTKAHPLWEGIEDGERFYFVHSYYVEPADPGPRRRAHRLRGRVHERRRGRKRVRGPVPSGEEPAARPPAARQLLRLAPLSSISGDHARKLAGAGRAAPSSGFTCSTPGNRLKSWSAE